MLCIPIGLGGLDRRSGLIANRREWARARATAHPGRLLTPSDVLIQERQLPILDSDPESQKPLKQALLAHDMRTYLSLVTGEEARLGFFDLGTDNRLARGHELDSEDVSAVRIDLGLVRLGFRLGLIIVWMILLLKGAALAGVALAAAKTTGAIGLQQISFESQALDLIEAKAIDAINDPAALFAGVCIWFLNMFTNRMD